jgi:hypothetical protein
MKNKKIMNIAAVILTGAIVLSLSACSAGTLGKSTAGTSSGTSSSAQAAPDQKSNGSTSAAATNVIYGQVTAVNGSEVTLALGTMGERGAGMTGTAQGSSSSAAAGSGSQLCPLTRNGKTMKITISDTGILTKQTLGRGVSASSGTAAGMSDITVDAILCVTLKSDGKTPGAVTIFPVPQMNGSAGGAAGSTGPAAAAGAGAA